MTYVDPFKLLDVTYKSAKDDVKLSFKNLALICHPDKGGNKEDMDVLYGAYRYVLEQIEYGMHGRTMEEEEEKFKRFMEEQKREPLPSFYEIMTDQANSRFNEDFEEAKMGGMEVHGMCYDSNYEQKMREEPEVFKRDVVVYKEPKTVLDMEFSEIYDYKNKAPKDFTGGGATDYVQAFMEKDVLPEYEEKDVEEEFNKLKKEYGF